MKGTSGVFGLNYTSLIWCLGFILIAANGSYWVSVDSDLVLHILYGRNMISEGILSSDPLLSGITDPPVLQEWLFEISLAVLERVFGLAGPVILFAVLLGSLMASLYRRMRVQGVCFWIALLYAIFIMVALRLHLIIRPHMLSWAAISYLVVLLENWHSGRVSFLRTTLAGSVLMLFWSNMHGGFLLGLVLTAIFAVDRLCIALSGRDRGNLWQAIALLIIFGLVSLANPWGWNLHSHLVAFLSNDFLIATTLDFQPPRLANGSLPVLFFTSIAVIVPMLLQWRHVALKDWLMLLTLFYIAVTSVRNIPFFGLIMLPIAALYLQRWLVASGAAPAKLILASSSRMEEDEGSGSGVGWPVLFLTSMIFFFAAGILRVELGSRQVPREALEWVSNNPAVHGQTIFADYLFAGYFLFATPIRQVYLHALNANYPDSRVRNYLNVESGEPGWEEILSPFEWAAVAAAGGQQNTFAMASCWEEVYRDEKTAIYHRMCVE